MNIYAGEPKHCDDYIEDKAQPKCLRAFLLFNRIPAHWRFKWEYAKKWKIPKLYANYGLRRVRVTMASRFGDVGITWRLNQESGYEERIYLDRLTNFSENP